MSTQSDPAIDAQSRQGFVYAVSVAFASVSAIVVSLRLYTRGCLIQSVGWDDWVILAALILSIGASVGSVLEAYWGLGRHVWMLSPDELDKQMKVFYFVLLTYNFANNVTKVSFLLQYRRIFSSINLKRICAWLLGFVTFWAVLQCVLLAVACVPLSSIIPSMADKCIVALPVWYASSTINIVTDFVIFAVPLPAVWRLRLRKQQKILVFSIFCLGFFTCIVSIIRITTLRNAAVTEDPTWDNTEAACWSLVELNCGILCASLPTLRPLLGKIVPGMQSTAYAKDYHMYGTGRDGPRTSASHGGRDGSDEALKMAAAGPAIDMLDALDYGLTSAGRPNHTAEVTAVPNEKEEPDQGEGPRTTRKILVTTETTVRRDGKSL